MLAAAGAGKLPTGLLEVCKGVVAVVTFVRQDVGEAALRCMSIARWIRWHLNVGHMRLTCAVATAVAGTCLAFERVLVTKAWTASRQTVPDTAFHSSGKVNEVQLAQLRGST